MNLRCFCCLFAAFTLSILTSAAEVDWPPGQAIPKFPTPAETLDAIEVQSLSEDEQLLFSSLQGHVNCTASAWCCPSCVI